MSIPPISVPYGNQSSNGPGLDGEPPLTPTPARIEPLPDFGGGAERHHSEPASGSAPGKLWNLPNTVVGLLWGAVGLPFGARVTFGNNAIQFERHPFTFSAVTLGNTISYNRDMGPEVEQQGVPIGLHERQHTLQGELLGPLYLPSNILGGLIALLCEGRWHGSRNWNESGPQQNPPVPWKKTRQ
ncbi:MAG: hypothetical protein KDD69_14040 [Bdellovibrionales bacterium]|nr:hypothetical protein [Bdellovibrionales bacterium]